MSDIKIGPFGFALFFSLFLAILKMSGIIVCENWVILIPIIVWIAFFIILVFIVGLITIYYLTKYKNNDSDGNE